MEENYEYLKRFFDAKEWDFMGQIFNYEFVCIKTREYVETQLKIIQSNSNSDQERDCFDIVKAKRKIGNEIYSKIMKSYISSFPVCKTIGEKIVATYKAINFLCPEIKEDDKSYELSFLKFYKLAQEHREVVNYSHSITKSNIDSSMIKNFGSMKFTKLFKSFIGFGSRKSENSKNKSDRENINNIEYYYKQENFNDDLDFLSNK